VELALRMLWPLQALLHVLLALPLTVAFGRDHGSGCGYGPGIIATRAQKSQPEMMGGYRGIMGEYHRW
jgi:hypothetical protein